MCGCYSRIVILEAQIIAAGLAFTCTPIAVWDGDGPIWCAEGPKVRLAGIAAREIDGECKPNHPCPTASGIVARDRLVSLLGGKRGVMETGHVRVSSSPIHCRSDGSAGGGRTAAWCVTAKSIDLNCAMVKSKVAVRWGRYWRGHTC